jgi:3-oxoacyl-[acyl-carrier-protein] synthase II
MLRDRTVVVTGLGVMTSIGCGRTAFWESLVSGKSGVRRTQAFDPKHHRSQIASEVLSFQPEIYLASKQVRRMARVSQLAVAGAIEAVKDAGLDLDKEDAAAVGCIMGTGVGDYKELEEQHVKLLKRGPGHTNPVSVPKVVPNMPAANVGIELGLHGPNFSVATACATGTHAIGVALGILRQGLAEVILAGGAESTRTPLVVDAYDSMGALSRRNDEPERASRPFDAERDGFVIGEGVGVLVLETFDHARKRGAEILAVLGGFGMTCDAFNIVLPEPDGRWAAVAMENAIRDAGIRKEDVGYVNAHGTSTKANDRVECLVIRKVFKDLAGTIPVSSNKSMLGHTLAAAGAIEAAATVLTLHHGIIPPTINQEVNDPECDLDFVPNEAREKEMKSALSNSFGFGGQNGVLAFSKA